MTKIEVQSATEEIAESIKRIDEAMKHISASKLTDKAIVVLLQEIIGTRNIKRVDIENVLWGLNNLKSSYLNK